MAAENEGGRIEELRTTKPLSNTTQADRLTPPLNPRYTFAQFVVGRSNTLAQAAAMAIAERAARAYNPLFIHGGVGLGKTHLLHSIGRCILFRHPKTRVLYMSSERFVNELINSIRHNKTLQFREKYRNIDVLLMDDIQFMAGKEHTQEEFFHTFNSIYESQGQIVLTSDCPPRSISTLEKRLRSRFEWGLVAEIQFPELETRIAIVKKKTEYDNIVLPDDVTLFIANNVDSSIRQLEGSLNRLLSYSSLTGEPIMLPMAQRVLGDLGEHHKPTISIDAILQAVADQFGLKPADLKAKDNSRRITEPRHLAMFLCRELTNRSLDDIGREFGSKHRSTVLQSIRKIHQQRINDPSLSALLTKLRIAIS